jgi:hypothetical protein
MAQEPKNPGMIAPKSGTKPQETEAKQPREYQTKPKISTKQPKTTKPNYTYNKRAFGRPSKYRPKYCKLILDYFTREHTQEYTETHTNRKGETWECSKLRAVPVPTFEGFCGLIGIDMNTLRDWKTNFPDFSRACSHAQAKQIDHLATVTGLGLYNSNWAVFMAKNVSDWRDRREIEHSGDVGISGLIEGLSDKAAEARAERSRIAGHN